MKIASIVGNRPQFIKAAPTSLALREAGLDEVVIHTGQHYDRELSQVFFEELGLAEPRYRLDLRTADPTVMQPQIEACLSQERPDWVIVDPTTVKLRAERAEFGKGRVYKILVTCRDASGNASTAATTVSVPTRVPPRFPLWPWICWDDRRW